MKKTLISLATVSAVTALTVNAEASDYTVESGDTLFKIANEHGTTVDKLQSLNGISSHLIYPGDVLKTNDEESASVETVEESTDGLYVIQPGDTLYKIGQKFDVNYKDIMVWNNLTSDLIFAGKTLVVDPNYVTSDQTSEAVVEAPVVEETSSNNEVVSNTTVEENNTVVETETVNNVELENAEVESQQVEETNTQEVQNTQTQSQETQNEVAEVQTQAEETQNQVVEAQTVENTQAQEPQNEVEQQSQAPAPQPAQTQVVGGSAASLANSMAATRSYAFGANTSTLVDCSAFAQQFMQAYKGISLPRTASAQMSVGTPVSNPQPGDLVFFNGGSHVGVYIGNGMMVDALNPSAGVGQRAVNSIYGSFEGYYRY